MKYDWMEPDELALWAATKVHGGGNTPCVDCPAWFQAKEREAGRCCRVPVDEERRAKMRAYYYAHRGVQ